MAATAIAATPMVAMAHSWFGMFRFGTMDSSDVLAWEMKPMAMALFLASRYLLVSALSISSLGLGRGSISSVLTIG